MSDACPWPTVWGVPDSYTAFFLRHRLSEHEGPLLHVAANDAALAAIGEMLAYLEPNLEILKFPAWDCLPYDRASPNPLITAERVFTLTRLLEPSPRRRVVLTTVHALMQRTPPRDTYKGQSLTIRSGEGVDQALLIEVLISNGYIRCDTVMEAGEFACRGGIFDLFPAAQEDPVRLDLFGDEVENIRRFDVATQRSGEGLDAFTLCPVSEVSLGQDAIRRFRVAWRDLFGAGAASDLLYQCVSDGRRYGGMEHYVPLFYAHMETLIDYMPGVAISLDHQAEEIFAARAEMIDDHFAARKVPSPSDESIYRPLPSHLLYLDEKAWHAILAGHATVLVNPFAKPDFGTGVDAFARVGLSFANQKAIEGNDAFAVLNAQLARWAGKGLRTYITAWSRGSRERISALLSENGLTHESYDDWAHAAGMASGGLGVIILGLERGFVSPRYAFISEQDLLGTRIARPQSRRRRAQDFISNASEIAEGDLVVHVEYGIGRYEGLETVSDGVAPHDCLRLLYDNAQRLYLPVENIELLSRFGSEQSGVALDRLGGQAWQARKAKMRERIRDIAADLIRTAAARLTKEAPEFQPPEGMWNEFCARFPFIETDDQSRAIHDVLEDFASGRPMDRLICGDVGFGKTEIALRAAFVAAYCGVQVAVVVPTTLLCRQHYRNFLARFAGFPIRVAQLSRLVNAKEAADVRAQLARGEIDIIIGTHALLAKGTEFRSLGLLIIDEEQHFGVAHKERLKAIREDVHVLTLSATPLPRTLQLALTGVREMSLIATPPTDRLAVRTFIMPFDSVVIREAIQRERFRSGQIFCVVPRIEDMDPMRERLNKIVPDAKIAQAHGRLTPAALERVMTEFSNGAYDILLSTNIVESGLDMPAVNTLIIHRADLFGLGQLYQLRGRVGRGKQRGYAYLTWPQSHRLSASSQKRLEVMQSLDALGAGFTLASHDLDLRGAGNLLGDEQSGHIKEVGIELYQKMLEDAVQDMRRDKSRGAAHEKDWTPAIILGLPVLIPDNYVPDLPQRLSLYRKIAQIANDEELDELRLELVDRFGTPPAEVINLLDVVVLKRLSRSACVERLEVGPKGMVIQFKDHKFPNPDGLLQWIERNRAHGVKLRPDHKLAIIRELPNRQRIMMAKKVLSALKKRAEAVGATQGRISLAVAKDGAPIQKAR